MFRQKNGEVDGIQITVASIVIVLILWGLSLWIGPKYAVWQQGLEGQAELAKADYSKQVAVQEAQAKKDSASLLADAEVLRAGGVAKANAIIGESLKNNEAYLRYLWITDVAGSNVDKSVVYVPTEANLPILEATRNQDQKVSQ